MPRPVVALVTDFGLRDHYVGAMKGAVLSVCPDATLVDITHEVPAHDVVAGALELAAAFHYFPAATVFLAVVDPGVGSTRRRIAAEGGGYRFVGPDNGLLEPALERVKPYRAVALTDPAHALAPASRTFEGRDWFAPAAGRLASGVPLERLGSPCSAIESLPLTRPRVLEDGVEGEVVRVDRFGNLITNVEREVLGGSGDALGGSDRGRLMVFVAGRPVGGLVRTYSEVEPGALCALVGSTGHVEVAVRGGSAAVELRVDRGALVRVLRRA